VNKALAGAGMLAVTAGALVAGCSSAAPAASRTPAVRVSAGSGDRLLGVFGEGETCDLTDGKQELFVEDGGEMPNGDGTCTREEQEGWKP